MTISIGDELLFCFNVGKSDLSFFSSSLVGLPCVLGIAFDEVRVIEWMIDEESRVRVCVCDK